MTLPKKLVRKPESTERGQLRRTGRAGYLAAAVSLDSIADALGAIRGELSEATLDAVGPDAAAHLDIAVQCLAEAITHAYNALEGRDAK